MVLTRYPTIVAILATGAAFAIAACAGLPQYYVSFLYTLFFWIALATSWGMLSGFTGYWSFGHAAFYGAGVYTAANLAGKWGVPFLLTVPVAALVGAGFAALIGVVVFRLPKLRGEFFALITLSITFVLAAILSNSPLDGGAGITLNHVAIPNWGSSAATTVYLLGLGIALISVLCAYGIYHSRIGMGLRAINDDEDAAEVKGVPTFQYKVALFALSSAIAASVGSIQAVYVGYVTVGETFSITIPLYVVLMSILGGARHWLGPTLGAVVIATALNSVAGTPQAELGKAGIAVALVCVILALPQGVISFVLPRRHLDKKLPPLPDDKDAVKASGTLAANGHDAQLVPSVLLECRGVEKRFGGVHALRGVDLQINSGEILALVGPNGSGKSTLINMISGHYPLSSGSIRLGAQPISDLAPHEIARSGIARTYQTPRMFGGMTARENVAICAVFGASQSPEQARADARGWMAFATLSQRENAFPAELTLQERKFLELARALATKPKLLLLDEVLCGLNPSEVERAITLIRKIRRSGTTIIFVEHLMRVVVELSDRVAVMDQGRLIALGEPRETMKDPKVISAYLGNEYAA